ncbi:MAG: hypothetical protein K8S97_12065, partial [Anaerolineae bacterium]|nr:hypothetical protein [Anaerolineae bacterium]
TTATGADIVDWSDGVTTRTFSWEAEVPLLTDGVNESYGLLIPNRDNPDVALVNGFYQSARGGTEVVAQMLFDLNTQAATAVWGLNETASGNLQPFELAVEAGDTFTPEWLTLDADNQLSGSSRGTTLTMAGPDVGVTFNKVPAPSGQYAISFVAENVAGETTLSESLLTINNDGLDATLRGYTDLAYGVNFLYPAHWLRPRFTPDGTRLFTGDLITDTFMSLFPYTDVASAEETDAAIRASWNTLDNLQVVQQQVVEINGLPAYVTDYSYTYQGANRVGAVIAIFVPSQGVGYAFDIDAPAESPDQAQAALQALVASINYFDPQAELGSGTWQSAVLLNGLVSFPVPATWGQEVSGNWTIYGPAADESTFVALGAEQASGMTNEQQAQSWVEQLQASVQNLDIRATEPFYIGGREWHVVVFTYDAEVTIGGAFFTTTVGGQDIVFWIEAPNAQFDALYADVFAVVLGGFEFGG